MSITKGEPVTNEALAFWACLTIGALNTDREYSLIWIGLAIVIFLVRHFTTGYSKESTSEERIVVAPESYLLTPADRLVLNQALATLIHQIGDKHHLNKEPKAPLYLDDRELCRLRVKIYPEQSIHDALTYLPK